MGIKIEGQGRVRWKETRGNGKTDRHRRGEG